MSKLYKKNYRKLDIESTIERKSLKIVPSAATKEFEKKIKNIFLPLLTNIFELKQMINRYKMELPSTQTIKMKLTPREILMELKQLQKDAEESQRWCAGIILQTSKGIEEVKELLLLFKEKSEKND